MATQSALDTNTTMQTPQQQPVNLVPMEAHLRRGVPGRLYSPHDRVGPILDAMASLHRGDDRHVRRVQGWVARGTVDAVLSNEELLKNKYPVKQVIDVLPRGGGSERRERTEGEDPHGMGRAGKEGRMGVRGRAQDHEVA